MLEAGLILPLFRRGVSQLGDILRATIVCRCGPGMRSVWEGLQREFGIEAGRGRLKNNLSKESRPPDMLMNALLKTGPDMRMPVEIQVEAERLFNYSM